MRERRTDFWSDADGSAMVEFAVLMPVALALFVATFQFSELVSAKRSIIHASRYAACELAAGRPLDTVTDEITMLCIRDAGEQGPGGEGTSPITINVQRTDSVEESFVMGDMVQWFFRGYDIPVLGGHIGFDIPESSINSRLIVNVEQSLQPRYFGLLGLEELMTEGDGESEGEGSWFKLGGDRPYSRYFVISDTWYSSSESEVTDRIRGLWFPIFGDLLSQLGDFLAIFDPGIHCRVNLDLIGPKVAPSWWWEDAVDGRDMGATEDQGESDFEREVGEYNDRMNQLRAEIAQLDEEIAALDAEIAQLDQEIANLDEQIANTSDPVERAALEAQRDAKQDDRDDKQEERDQKAQQRQQKANELDRLENATEEQTEEERDD